MTIKYDNGNLVIDLHALLACVDAATRASFIESLACDDEIIRHVTAQILDRWTESVYAGGSLVTAVPAPASSATPLDTAWREVAKRSSDVAKREIERLEEALGRANKEIGKLRDEYFDLRANRQREY
jgi:hypothetical protein